MSPPVVPIAPIAHLGTFDVLNFGDLLFPLVLEKRLGATFGPIAHTSPVGGRPPLDDAADCLALADLPEGVSAVIVGGGHLIHASPTDVEDYRSTPESALLAYPSLWLGAAHRALRANSPLVWNAPGIPSALGSRSAPVLAWAASFCDYLALRDERSLRLLREAGFEGDAEVVPDTALEIADLFHGDELDAAYRHAFHARGRKPAVDSIAFHVNRRYVDEEPGLVAARIERICRQAGAEPILLALGGCHEDDVLARELGESLRMPALVVDRLQSLQEATACIARSRAYVGSSLHGMITACAFGVRSAIVAREPADGGKFSGFLERVDLGGWLMGSWQEAEQRTTDLLAADATPWARVGPAMAPALDRHWRRVRDALGSPPRHSAIRERAAERFAALRQTMLDEAGVYAALLPHQAALAVEQQAALNRSRAHAAALKASYRVQARQLRKRIEELEEQLDRASRDETS